MSSIKSLSVPTSQYSGRKYIAAVTTDAIKKLYLIVIQMKEFFAFSPEPIACAIFPSAGFPDTFSFEAAVLFCGWGEPLVSNMI